MIITILVIGGLVTAAFLFFWNQLREYLNGAFRTWLTEKLGETVGEGFAHFIVFVDSGAVSAKNILKAGYKFFRMRVLGAKRKFVKKANSNEVEATREIYTDLGGGKILKRTEEEIISYEDMPDCVRREMLRQQTNEAELNEKELVLAKAQDIAQQSQDEELKELMTMAA
jgi:ribosomal protein L20A (L18A)